MNTMDRYLRVVLASTGAFTVVMIALYLLTGAYPETLTTCWFQYMLGECGFLGLIKITKQITATQSERAASKQAAEQAMAAMAKAEEGTKHGQTDGSQ